MRRTGPQPPTTDLRASQAAQLLRSGRLGYVLVSRAETQAGRHRIATGDQADRLRRAVGAHGLHKHGSAGDRA
ncbi:MAG: hypothetical protein AAGJ54_01120 [Planctomycetota bacterium]